MDDKDGVDVLGVRVCQLSAESLVNFISKTISMGRKGRAVYINIHTINLAQDLIWFRDFINASDVAYCDGYGVKWGAHFLGLRIPERLSPPDWIAMLAAECSREHYSVYLLGARPGVAEKVSLVIKQQFDQINIVGTHHGYFNKSLQSAENKAVVQAINNACPDILLVSLGMPLQEHWLMENWESLRVKFALPVGALFDYMANELPRAPRWMTDHGLEWLGRVIIEPRRLWRRYLLGNPRFLWRLIKERLARTG